MYSMLNQPGQMQLIPLAFLLAAAVSTLTAVQALLFVCSGYRRGLYGFHAAMSGVVTLLFLVDHLLYATQAHALSARLMQWHVALVLAFYPALFGFVAVYSRQDRPHRWLLPISLISAGLIALDFSMPYSLRFESLENMRVPLALLNEDFVLPFGTVTPWNIVSRGLTTMLLLWGLTRSVILYRQGARRAGALLGLALMGILVASLSGLLVDLGLFQFIYLGGLAYFGLILSMHFSLGMDLHDMNRSLEKLSNNLKHEIKLRERTEDYIRQLGFRDSLTGLPNRARLNEQLDRMLAQPGSGKHGALIILGLDDFKTINTVLGHDVGDAVLKLVSQRLEASGTERGLLTRYGGDEFILLLPDLGLDQREPTKTACDIAGRCLDSLTRPLEFDGRTLEIGACVGISVFPYPSHADRKPLQCAEMALSRAKSLGRGNIQLYESGMQAELAETHQLEIDMRAGLKRAEFQVFYQPQVDSLGKVLGAEALLRWRHPGKGFISPAVFIPIAERSGMIHALGRLVLQEACGQVRRLGGSVPAFGGHISVNISNWQFNQSGFEKDVRNVLADAGADASRLTLEITESLFIRDLNEAIARINALRSLGLRFSIDDFGTGYASLSYLRRLPIDELKIDQSFVKSLGTNARDTALVETIVRIARHMDMQVVAEGVETEVQHATLAEMKIWALQGYYIARPMDKDAFRQWLIERYETT